MRFKLYPFSFALVCYQGSSGGKEVKLNPSLRFQVVEEVCVVALGSFVEAEVKNRILYKYFV